MRKFFISCLLSTFIVTQLNVFALWNISDEQYQTMLKIASNEIFSEPIKIIINGKLIPFDQAPILEEDGTIVVPIRAIAEGLGKNVKWNQGNQTVVVQRGVNTAIFEIGNKLSYTNEIHTLDIEPRIVNNRTLIPLKSISDIFGATAEYDMINNAVVVTCDEINDESILKDFRKTHFSRFSFFSSSFINEYVNDPSYAWLTVLSDLKGFGKKIIIGDLGNYEKDLYKESIINILANVTEQEEPDLYQAWEEKLFGTIQQGSEITYDMLKEKWENEWSDQSFELSNWGEASIGKYVKIFNESIGEFADTIDKTAFTIEELATLFTDYTKHQLYIDVFSNAANGDKVMTDAVEELQYEYADGLCKAISSLGDAIKDELSGKMIDATLSIIGQGASSMFNFITFGTEKIMNWTGQAEYAKNTGAAMILSGICSNLWVSFDDLMNTVYDLKTDTILSTVKKDQWNKLKTSFEVTKASYIEQYKCMLELSKKTIEKVYLKEQMDFLTRLKISNEIPQTAEEMFHLEDYADQFTIQGSAPGVVTTDGTYMYFPIDGSLYREKLDGSERTPIWRTQFSFGENIDVRQRKYQEVSCQNKNLYIEMQSSPSACILDLENLSIMITDKMEKEYIDSFLGIKTRKQTYLGNTWYCQQSILPVSRYSIHMQTPSGKDVKLFSAQWIRTFCVSNGYVYYIAGNGLQDGLYRYHLKSRMKEVLVENLGEQQLNGCDQLNIVGDWLYLYKNPNNFSVGILYRTRLEDWVFEPLHETELEKLTFTQNYFFDDESDSNIKENNSEEKDPQNQNGIPDHQEPSADFTGDALRKS